MLGPTKLCRENVTYIFSAMQQAWESMNTDRHYSLKDTKSPYCEDGIQTKRQGSHSSPGDLEAGNILNNQKRTNICLLQFTGSINNW